MEATKFVEEINNIAKSLADEKVELIKNVLKTIISEYDYKGIEQSITHKTSVVISCEMYDHLMNKGISLSFITRSPLLKVHDVLVCDINHGGFTFSEPTDIMVTQTRTWY